ncbi:WD40 repeat domain-containing protein [Nocardia altamirensis]|uniref:WD40 repeat domain-containing protein n=1 Tax=Nocardia altamirensis TaxID=472158 RepID=UPI00084071DC|nr:WD40 repeat domain-containing protein [Nocardia altamirensis]
MSRPEGRRLFAVRLGELFVAAGSPPVKSVVRAANARIPEGATRITAQRISDWRRGNRTPATFVSVRPVLEVLIAEARRRAADTPGIDASLLDLVRWHEDWKGARVDPPAPDIDREPYRGLWAYRPEDSDLFFGRDEAKQQLLEVMSAAESSELVSMVLLLGASGIGKTSLLATTLLAAPGARTPITMTPGDDPMTALAIALDDRPQGPCLLLVDQGEELFTRCANDALRQRFLAALTMLAGPQSEQPTMVVMSFDTAHLPKLLRYPELMMVLRDHVMLLNPMTPEEMREAIVRPAAVTGLRVEDSLVEVLLQDLATIDAHSSVRLPLVSFVLAATWANRRGRTLTLDAYREAGGLARAGAVGGEMFWSRLTEAEHESARHVLIALTITGPTGVVRNRMPVQGLIEESADPAAVRSVIARLTELRMVVRRGEDIELVHDLLLTGWPRMAEWLAEEKEFAPARQRIEADAREWARQERPTSLLYSRTRLEDAAEWMQRTESSNRLAREFVSTSLSRQQARTVRRRLILTAVAMLAVVALALSVVVVGQRAKVAQEHKDVLRSQLIEQSQRIEDVDGGLSAQLALAAYRLNPADPAARARLLAAQVLPLSIGSAAAHKGLVRQLALSQGRKLLASAGDDGFIRLWDIADPLTVTPVGPELSGHRGHVESVAFAPDGGTLVSVGGDGTVRLWDVQDPQQARQVGQFDIGTALTTVAYLPTGRTVVVGGIDGTVTFLNVESPQAVRRLGEPLAVHTGAVRALTQAQDSGMLASAGDDRTVRLWDVSDAERPAPLGVPLLAEGSVQATAFGPGGRFAAGTADGMVQVWNVTDPNRPQLIGQHQRRPVPITRLEFWLGGRLLTVADAGGTLRGLNTNRPDRIAPIGREIRGNSGSVQSFVIVSDAQVVTAGADGRLRTWSHARVDVPIVFAGALSSIAFDKAGKVLASGLRDGQVNVWNVANPAYSRSVSEVQAGLPERRGTEVALRPDGQLLATAGGGEVKLWNLADPAHPVPLGALPGAGVGGPLAFSPKGDRLLTGIDRRSLQLWDVSDPGAVRPLANLSTGHDRHVELAAFAPGRSLVAAADDDSRIHVWDSADPRKPPASLDVHGANVRALLFGNDGKTLFGADDDGMIRWWDVSDLADIRELGEVRAHTAGVRTLALDQSGRRLASGGDDQTARVWNIADPSDVKPLGDLLEAQAGWMWFLRFDPNDESRLIGVGDQMSASWYIDPDDVAAKLCAASAAQIDEETWKARLPSVPYVRTC